MIEEIDFIQPKKIVGQLISIDVLDKIRAEIQKLRNCSCSCSDGIIDDVEEILDKYKASPARAEGGEE